MLSDVSVMEKTQSDEYKPIRIASDLFLYSEPRISIDRSTEDKTGEDSSVYGGHLLEFRRHPDAAVVVEASGITEPNPHGRR